MKEIMKKEIERIKLAKDEIINDLKSKNTQISEAYEQKIESLSSNYEEKL